MNYWLIFAAMISTNLLSQQATNSPPPPPIAAPAAPAVDGAGTTPTNAPAPTTEKKKAKKSGKKAAAKKKDAARELRTVPLVAGSATVIASNVNVRGQAKLNSEVITRLNKGQTVSVLEEVTLKNSGPDEPSAWAKIILPPTAHAWVSAAFIDATNKSVIPKKLKLRGGPGENYSVLGMLKQGDQVKEVSSKGEWMEIEAPAEACAFVAAQYLKQEAPGTVPSAPTETAPTPATVAENPTIAPAPAEPPVTPPPADTPVVTPAPATPEVPAVEEPPPRRIVQHEGLVRGTFSIQAPTRYELISLENHKVINYLFSASSGLELSRYKGLHIIVTGEEGLDERWKSTPVITIQKIQVLE